MMPHDSDEHERNGPPTEEELETVVAALLQVDPTGISGKHDAKQRRADENDEPE